MSDDSGIEVGLLVRFRVKVRVRVRVRIRFRVGVRIRAGVGVRYVFWHELDPGSNSVDGVCDFESVPPDQLYKR